MGSAASLGREILIDSSPIWRWACSWRSSSWEGHRRARSLAGDSEILHDGEEETPNWRSCCLHDLAFGCTDSTFASCYSSTPTRQLPLTLCTLTSRTSRYAMLISGYIQNRCSAMNVQKI